MPSSILIADSGSTKAEWCLLSASGQATVFTQGMSPYFLNKEQIVGLLQQELLPQLTGLVTEVFYYGTGCAAPANKATMQAALEAVFSQSSIIVDTDLTAAARATCGRNKGIACILGTGSNSGYYDGTQIVKNSPGLGYILGDEGSGAHLGKKVIQYYLYNTFDEEIKARFDAAYQTNKAEILEAVYRKPLPNRYLSSFAVFLAQNRGHYMIENILEDGLNDFFFNHLAKYGEIWNHQVHFVGSVAAGFKDVLAELCRSYGFDLGSILKNPMEGLVKYHQQ